MGPWNNLRRIVSIFGIYTLKASSNIVSGCLSVRCSVISGTSHVQKVNNIYTATTNECLLPVAVLSAGAVFNLLMTITTELNIHFSGK